MIHAYDKNYLSKAQNNLASMFDFAVYDLEEDLSEFYQKFFKSRISALFETGDSTVIVGKSGVELTLEIIGDETLASKYRPVADRTPEYWCGWALVYFQWYSGLTFKEIDNYIPISEISANSLCDNPAFSRKFFRFVLIFRLLYSSIILSQN